MMATRRRWLQGAWASSLGGLFPFSAGAAAQSKPTIYQQLGVRPVVNFQGTFTTIGASKQLPELFRAQAEAAREYVVLEELQEAIGNRIARLTGTEGAMVSTGAAGAIAIGTYACVAGDDPEKIKRLPNMEGMKNEVIIQKVHRISYDHAVRGAGVKIVEVETLDELKRAINPNTAMMYFLPGNTDDMNWGDDWISLEDTLKVTKPAAVPVLADCANLLPPWNNIPKVAKAGVDLLAISGGKHMRGPQCSGILAGPKSLLRAAWLNSNPHSDSNGRPMKVGREEMVALWMACEKYAALDFKKIDKQSERQAGRLAKELKKIRGVKVSKAPFSRMRRVHRVIASWDEQAVGLTAAEVKDQLMEGDPRIAAAVVQPRGIRFTVFMNDPGEEKLAAGRMREIFGRVGG
ncbi:MAG: aminotransferase class V-fold PLP-dependent enzyme [bacterium]|nr:aminotransferase class V-fold PLP-dependent enzyme [bacterium]